MGLGMKGFRLCWFAVVGELGRVMEIEAKYLKE